MAHVITEPCIHCKDTACATVCPSDCIHPLRDEDAFSAATQLFIDPDNCIDCCLCVDECPTKAIFQEDDIPPQWRHFVQLNAEHFQKKS